MAVVLSSEESSYFSTSGLRRSYSQPNLDTRHNQLRTLAPPSRRAGPYPPTKPFEGPTTPSSSPPSPCTVQVESADLSCSSTPASNFSLPPSDYDEDGEFGSVHHEEQIVLEHCDDVGYFHQLEDLEPPPSPGTGDSYVPSPNDHETSTSTSRPESPVFLERAEDDIAVRMQPSRHVDYLSHNWREEDIWSSWKLIVSRRRDYSNSARLENASWRTWMKSKNKLRTVSPETLNWLKDCDVTWLYGPLQTGNVAFNPMLTESSSIGLSTSASFIKKPILKKRSVSELMLQRSLSTSSLVKQAAAAVQAQQIGDRLLSVSRPVFGRSVTDTITLPFSPMELSSHILASAESSGIMSPSGERKHIHFNEQVEQCIAVDVRGDDDEEDPDVDRFAYDSDSDDDAIMMKRTAPKKRRPVVKRTKSTSSVGDSKTIAMLPSTTLKYLQDTPDTTESAMKHSAGMSRSPVLLSPSSSQETLKPSKPSGKLFSAADEDEEDEEDDDDDDDDGDAGGAEVGEDGFGFGWRSPHRLVGDGPSGLHLSPSSSSLTAEPAGMRRTASGMFMPYEEGEAGSTHEGILGRVIDTVNTARDIAHVIWNVGWRK